MRKKGFRYSVVCCLLLIGGQACHRVDQDHAPGSVSEQKEVRSVSRVDSSKGNGFEEAVRALEPVPEIEQGIDNLWMVFPGELERSFRKGREDFLSKKYRTAAQQIQKSTIYVKLQSLRASGPTKRVLLESEAALSMLAKEVQEGKMYSLARLDATYAAAQRAMARLHLEKAKQAHAQKELRTAGVELRAAEDSLSKAAVWTGDHVYPPLMDCLDRAENDARRLTTGEERSPSATRKTLAVFGVQIDRLDRKAEVEEVKGLFVGETQFYLKRAQDRFENRVMTGAAEDMRRAAACMAVEAIGTFGETELLLGKEIEALRRTAAETENGSFSSSKKLQRRFASAHYALARVHCLRAGRYDAQQYYKRTVTTLGVAVMHLESAVAWAGKGMNNSSTRVSNEVKDMARKMREGLSVKPEEISAAVSDLKKTIERLDYLSESP
jgi:hypothetical protein